MARFLRAACLIAAFIVVLVVSAAVWLIQWGEAEGPAAESRTIRLDRGLSITAVGQVLATEGLVDQPYAFAVLAYVTRSAGGIKAGEYAIPAHASPDTIMATLRSGQTVVHRLVVPEGTTTIEVVKLVGAAEPLHGEIRSPPSEGALLPETYFYTWGDDRQALLDRMREAMATTVRRLWADRAPGLPLNSPEDAVTLASIVEKETAIETERPHIAAVFFNRLRLGMKLQSDPTVIYALTDGAKPLGRAVEHADLSTQSPYNTYEVMGLPPGPIGNPGRAALEAVLHPIATNDLYFVADGTGRHAFAATLEDQDKNIERWRKATGTGSSSPSGR